MYKTNAIVILKIISLINKIIPVIIFKNKNVVYSFSFYSAIKSSVGLSTIMKANLFTSLEYFTYK